MRAFKKKLRSKLSPWHDLNVCLCDEFWAARNGKKWSFGLLRPNLPQLGLFHPYFVCKCSFREISMIKIVILDQCKPISLILKIKKSKIQKSEICKLHIYKSGNKTSIQPILKSNSTSFMLNNIFLWDEGWKSYIFLGGGLGEWGNCPNFVLKV